MKIYMELQDGGGCGLYRNYQPAVFCAPELLDQGVDLKLASMPAPDGADVYVLNKMPCDFDLARRFLGGHKVVMSWDDNGSCIPVDNPCYKGYSQPETQNTIRFMHKHAVANIVSTEPLKEWLESEGAKNVFVCPNLVDLKLWDFPVEKKPGKIKVGWAGSAHHQCDLPLIIECVSLLINKYDLEFYFMGDWCEVFGTWTKRSPRYMEFVSNSPKVIFVDPVETKLYPQTLTKLGIDIGLIPLAKNEFNNGKSWIKLGEMTLAGMACVCNNMPPYADFHNEIHCLKVEDDEFFPAVDRLINNATLRNEMRERCYNKIVADHSWQSSKKQIWIDTFIAIKELVS